MVGRMKSEYTRTRGYFYKLPVEIEAWRLNDYNGAVVAEWCGGTLRGGDKGGSAGGHIIIDTLEGRMTASPGDWIIRGVQGEFYPCKPDIFDATYRESLNEDTTYKALIESETYDEFERKVVFAGDDECCSCGPLYIFAEGDARCGSRNEASKATCLLQRGHEGNHRNTQGHWR